MNNVHRTGFVCVCVCASAESRTQKKQIVSKRLNCFQQKKCKKVKIK